MLNRVFNDVLEGLNEPAFVSSYSNEIFRDIIDYYNPHAIGRIAANVDGRHDDFGDRAFGEFEHRSFSVIEKILHQLCKTSHFVSQNSYMAFVLLFDPEAGFESIKGRLNAEDGVADFVRYCSRERAHCRERLAVPQRLLQLDDLGGVSGHDDYPLAVGIRFGCG